MKWINIWLPVVAVGFTAGSAVAATSYWEVDHDNIVPGTVANALFADGQGDDWTGEVLLVELTQGSVHNAPAFDGAGTQDGFWGLVPGLQWDSAVGIPRDGTLGFAGGSAGGCLGGISCFGPIGLLLADASPQLIDATWFNTNQTDTAQVQTGTITLSEDARGTWSRIISFASGQIHTEGLVENGVMVVPEPASLTLMGLCGFALLRRR